MMRLLLVALIAPLASAAYFRGIADSDNGYQFIGKFVVDTNPDGGDCENNYEDCGGRAMITLTPTVTAPEGSTMYKDVEVLLFDDEDDSWPSVYNKGLSCEEAKSRAKNGGIKWAVDGQPGSVTINQSLRKRYWFTVLAKCTGGKLENIEYVTHWDNFHRGSWGQELGANQAGLQTLYLIFGLIFVPFMLVHFRGVKQLYDKLQFMHPLVKLFAVVIVLQFAAILARMCYWLAFVHNGVGLNGAQLTGSVLESICEGIFIMILMLLAKGWTISGAELPGKFSVIGIILAFMALDIAILVLTFADLDPAATKPSWYVTTLRIALSLVWMGFAAWFCTTIYKSYNAESNDAKKALYRNLALAYVPWFFGLPITLLLSTFIAPWLAQRIVETVTLAVSTAAYLVLSYLLWPSHAEKYFQISTPDTFAGPGGYQPFNI